MTSAGSCSISISSPTAGTTTVKAIATLSVGGVSVHRETGDAHAADSADATTTWGSPTAVTVSSLTASPGVRGTALLWRTATESDLLGFEIWRSTQGGASHRLNPHLIPAANRVTGSTYRFRDRSARRDRGYVYRLRVLRLDGSRFWAASVRT